MSSRLRICSSARPPADPTSILRVIPEDHPGPESGVVPTLSREGPGTRGTYGNPKMTTNSRPGALADAATEAVNRADQLGQQLLPIAFAMRVLRSQHAATDMVLQHQQTGLPRRGDDGRELS